MVQVVENCQGAYESAVVVPQIESYLVVPRSDLAQRFFQLEYGQQSDFPEFEISTIIREHLNRDYRPYAWSYMSSFLAEDDFYFDPNHAEGIHGPFHEANVLINFLIIAQGEDLSEEEMLLGAVAALAHDSGRFNDNEHPGHGSISAERFRTVIRSRLEQRGIVLTDDQAEVVMQLCIHHETPYEEVTYEDFREGGRYENLFKAFTDADKLDRYRDQDAKLGEDGNMYPTEKWWTRPEFLKTSTGLALYASGFSKYLSLSSQKERCKEQISLEDLVYRKCKQLKITDALDSRDSKYTPVS